MERKHRALLLALPTVLTLLFFFVAPMVYILVHTLHENGLSDFVDFFGDPFYRNILWVTLRVSLVSTPWCWAIPRLFTWPGPSPV